MKTILFVLFLFPIVSFAQQKKKCDCYWNTTLEAGAAGGEKEVKPLFTLSSGWSVRNFHAGIGLGLDYYRFRSVPLFADTRFYLDKRKKGLLYARAGYNFPFSNESEINNWGPMTTNEFNGGFYMDAGVGHTIVTGKLNRLFISAGYSHKAISNRIGFTYPCLIPPCPENFETYKYSMGRIIAKLGWTIGK